MVSGQKPKIAVVGAGVAGIASSYYLAESFDVTLFESNRYLGGHTNTVEVPSGPDAGLAVDTGFIVCNDKTYPEFHKFLADLKVPVRSADMSFGYFDVESGLQYAGTSIGGLFAQPSNLFSYRYLKMLCELFSFNGQALRDLERGALVDISLGQYLSDQKVSKRLIRDYLVPMGAAIWSSPDMDLLSFPADSFFSFFRNHGLLVFRDRPQWQTVVGGSFQYVKRFRELFKGEYFTDCAVVSITRTQTGILVKTSAEEREFDYVVIATHADQALKLLADPSPSESEALSPWKYHINTTVLHTDRTFLPPIKRAWASWNYRRERAAGGDEPVSVTYYMNRLQGFKSSLDYCVTLNPRTEIGEGSIVAEFNYTHPSYTSDSIKGRELLRGLLGQRSTYYCGSYFGFGFHEDAIKSARRVVDLLKEKYDS